MNERLRYKRALVLVLAVVLCSFLPCSSFEVVVDDPSAPEVDFAEEHRDTADSSSIEQIFQSPKSRRNAASGSKPEPRAEVSRRSPPGENLVRAKREGSGKKGGRKSPREAAKVAAEKRSVADRAGKSSPRVGRAVRSSRDAANQADRLSADYEAGSDDGSDYAEVLEDDSRLAEDRFIDQDERSILYDDLEEKDVVKRGVAGAEDYEELDDRVDEPENGLEERGSSEDAAEKARARGGARVATEQHISKKRQIPVSSGSSDSALKDAKRPEKESPVADDRAAGRKESRLAEDRAVDADRGKPDRATSDEADQSKRNVAVDAFETILDADGSRQAPSTNDRAQLATEEGKSQDTSSPCDKKSADEPPDPSGVSKLEEAKAAEALAPAGTAAVAAAGLVAGAPKTETRAGSPDNSINPDGPTAEQSEQSEQSDREYEKRVEEQIQRKIDSIKEEIKREIAESEKLEEIESNNAKFDELLDQQEDEQNAQDEQAEQRQLVAEAAAAATSEKKTNPSKRSVASSDRLQKGANGDERPTKRRKRQDGANLENADSSSGSNSKLEKKSTGEGVDGKRIAAPSLSAPGPIAMAPRKRDAPREAYLVKRDRSKKKRRRRSREYERGSSREAVKAASISQPTELAAPSHGESNSVASLAENAEELGPLASEYGEAFGGLQGEPGLTLARFKRIKRVLRPRTLEA